MTTTPVTIGAHLYRWDAKKIYGNGFDHPPTDPEAVNELLEQIGSAVATEGAVVAVPGPKRGQALIISCEGPGVDGAVVDGSSTVHLW